MCEKMERDRNKGEGGWKGEECRKKKTKEQRRRERERAERGQAQLNYRVILPAYGRYTQRIQVQDDNQRQVRRGRGKERKGGPVRSWSLLLYAICRGAVLVPSFPACSPFSLQVFIQFYFPLFQAFLPAQRSDFDIEEGATCFYHAVACLSPHGVDIPCTS